MLANDFQHRGVGKSLFVITKLRGHVDAGENCGLPGSALRPAVNAERRVGGNNESRRGSSLLLRPGISREARRRRGRRED